MTWEEKKTAVVKDLTGLADLGDPGATDTIARVEKGDFDKDIEDMHNSPAKVSEISDHLIQLTRLR